MLSLSYFVGVKISVDDVIATTKVFWAEATIEVCSHLNTHTGVVG